MEYSTFTQLSDKLLSDIIEALESQDCDNVDLEYTRDFITLNSKIGTFVINKHSISRQIWLSSPISGPYKFFYKEPKWVDKSGKILPNLLEEELNIKLPFLDSKTKK
jgi:CyaY protein